MKKYHLLLVLLSLFFITCSEHDRSESYGDLGPMEFEAQNLEEEEEQPPPTNSPPPPSDYSKDRTTAQKKVEASIEKGSKIIKDGNIEVEVKDLKIAKAQIDSTLKIFKAYYENEDYQSAYSRLVYHLKIRVPTENFETLLAAVEFGEGKIIKKNISARDVTEEYVDVAVRLENNKAYLNRYQELLKKANSIKDILDIQEKARGIEEEIDARTGRLKYIDDKVRYSTLTLRLFQPIEQEPVVAKRNFGQQLVDAFSNGIEIFLDFMLFLVNIWPFILLIGLLWGFRKQIRGRLSRKKTKI